MRSTIERRGRRLAKELRLVWRRRRQLLLSILHQVGLQPVYRDGAGFEVPTEYLATGYLSDVGWYRTVDEGRVVDVDGRPMPWLVYPMIRLLSDRCKASNLSVFEYGAGSSTLWWAERAERVTSVEHDATWYDSLLRQVPSNVALLHIPLAENHDYERSVAGNGPFDVIVIDGRRRSACGPHATRELSHRGVIIWDNSDRPRYAAALEAVEAAGFRRLELWGLAPRDNISSCTSVLYRPGNLLGI